MATITFTIPDAKLPRILAAMKGVYPIPEVLSDPNDTESPMVPEFTDNQWGKESLRRFIVKTVQRWESKLAIDAAKAGVEPDDTIVS